MKSRQHAERLAPARRLCSILNFESAVASDYRKPAAELERAAWEQAAPLRKSEGYAFMVMGRKLAREAHELKRERYVTAVLGVKTSWPRILDAAKYVVCAEAR